MKNRNLLILITIVGIASIGYAIFTLTRNAPTVMPYVEIRDYQGQRLSSIEDFRENSIRGPQNISEEDYQLIMTGLVQYPQALTYQQILSSYPVYEKVVTLHCVEGWSVTILWEGIRISELLQEAGIESDATTVIFYAADGYSTSLPLKYLEENQILMAYKMNGVTLPVERGFPFQLVAESQWGYKWIKWITSIELSDDANYEGYWERRGFPNAADIP
jgi:DMSO/TMAO reductase YedYZ molybdopterin-dependent catalytic subunit